ncbi:TM2 domain-containing protein [Deinococcus arenicola]|uniref:TM2 domain-containing protein n=1 Tax=Deinococcus arenicola TaxID=2994950 RepID=A0ABU4DKW0_9DEIO|nr:TM2 domain-containing protein [Deinococcus sp. ZS9-10]MDV6373065.1 TM2 domain-containing protein [Deinococcus sp. ZS9-10]
MTNPDDQKNPAREGNSPAQGRSPQGNAPSWVDDVLGSSNLGSANLGSSSVGSAGTGGPDLSESAASSPNLSKSPSPAHDLRIPEPAPATPAPATETDDWISRVTGSPPPPPANAPHIDPQTNQTQPSQTQPRASTPGLDAWGEAQRPAPAPVITHPVLPSIPPAVGDVAQKRLITGLLAIFLGSLGVHKFYLGLNTQGIMILGANIGVWILALLVGLLTFGFGLLITVPLAGVVSSALCILGLVEGIIYLTKSDANFGREYLVGKKPWL